MLAARGYRVTGIDAPGTGSAGFPESVQLLEADLDLGLPPLSGRFDFVICADVLEHLKRPEDMLEQIHGRLAAGGRLLASLPNSGNLYFRWNVLCGRFPAHSRGLFDRTHLHFYTWQGWQDLFTAAAFRIEKLQCSGVPVSLALEKWQASGAVHVLEWLSYEAAQLWKTMLAYQFVVSAVES